MGAILQFVKRDRTWEFEANLEWGPPACNPVIVYVY